MNQEEISLELLSIIISDIPKRQQTKTIKYLIDSNILNSKENNLCEKLLENMQYYGDIRVEQTLYKINCEIDFKDIPVINKTSDVFEHIEKFIESRREEQNKIIIEKALESSTSETFNKEISSAVFQRYANSIKVQCDYSFRDLEYYMDYEAPTVNVSSANKDIDNFLGGGFENGTITTIIENNYEHEGIWNLNIVYKAINEGKNVLLISLKDSSKTIYRKLLSRHSCDETKFNKKLNFQDICDNSNEKSYSNIYNDFQENLYDRLIIFDEKEFDISTYINLQRLIVYAQNQFTKLFDHGIDLIVIDRFDNMKLSNGTKLNSNKVAIINEYYTYLRSQAKCLLGIYDAIPIILNVYCTNDYYVTQNEGTFSLLDIHDLIKSLSDNIVAIYGDKNYKRNNVVRMQVLKSRNKISEFPISVTADYDYCYIQYEVLTKEDKDNIINEQQEEIKSLIKSNQSLTEMLYNKNNQDNSVDDEYLDQLLKDVGLENNFLKEENNE